MYLVVLVGIGCVLGYLVMLVVYWLFIGQKELVVYWWNAYTTNFRSKTPGKTFVSLVVSNIYRDEARMVVYWSPIIGRTEIKILVLYWSCMILAENTTNFLGAVKPRNCLRFFGLSILRTASIFFFQGLSPFGVNQYPSQSVSLTAHSHLLGLTVKPLSTNLLKMVSKTDIWLSQEFENAPTPSI